MNKVSWYLYLAIFLLLEGLFPIFSYFALQQLSTLWLICFSTGIAVVFCACILWTQNLFSEYRRKDIWMFTFLSSFFLGLGGILYFFWIKYSSPSTASILLLLQSFFAFIIFNLLWKEPYHTKQIFWAILMCLGGVIVLYEGESFINIWAWIMIIVTIVSTLWNYYIKQASLLWVNPFFLLFNRSVFVLVFTGILALIFIWPIDVKLIGQNFVWIFLIWFFVLFLGKALWIMSLAKLDWFVAISTFPIIPVLVTCFSILILHQFPTYREVFWFIPILLGTLFLTKKNPNIWKQ